MFDITKTNCTDKCYFTKTCDEECNSSKRIVLQRRLDITIPIVDQVKFVIKVLEEYKKMTCCVLCNKQFVVKLINNRCRNCIMSMFLSKLTVEDCSICLEPIHFKYNRISICKKHFIHKSCCDYMVDRNSCPICRQKH